MKEQSNGVPETCLPNGPLYSRGISKDRYAAYLIMARRLISTPRPDTSTQAFLHPQLFPYIQTADHTLRNPDFSGVSEYEQPRTGEAGCREILNASTFAVPRRTTPDSGG
jgi:hypothetical protein